MCLAGRILPCLVKLPGWTTHTCGSNPLVLSSLHSRVLLTTLLGLISLKDTNKLFGPKANSFLYPHFLDLCYLILTHILLNFFLETLAFLFSFHNNTICMPPTSLQLLL